MLLTHAQSNGIIPARAGFTDGRNIEITAMTDHPRSRGVYSAMSSNNLMYMGSSPLARGLRCYHARVRVCGRIIPARAGFTPV